jgi:hypothetical protein
MIENMQEENEQNLVHQETTNGFIDEKIKLLEEAFNLTLAKIDDHKVGCTLIKKKVKFHSYISKFRRERVGKSYVTNGLLLINKYLRISSYTYEEALPHI